MKSVTKLLLILAAVTTLSGYAIEPSELKIKNVRFVSDELITGGQPTSKQIEQLRQLGVKNIINLRGEDEFYKFDEKVEVESKGLNYVNLQIIGKAGVTIENAKLFAEIMSKQQGKTFVHCASGNRVGAMFALSHALNEGKSLEEAIEFGEKAGMRSLKEKVTVLIKAHKEE
ncbi:MAG: protein tyrosine phosphatase family protein [Kangiellaceae bacterium]|nr:protein tyrosine phosphatase family protein [Kangiellaceae bacterium]MCW8998155.1 protein tyrosine phosphatase family protein [Kangiellaceae bacterium]